MADPRTFTLIGEFKDGITPELERINRTLTSLKTSFGNLGGKGARNASRDLGRFSVAVNSLNENLKQQNVALRAAVAPLREYRLEIGKTVAAYKKLNQEGGNVSGLERTNRALREQMLLMNQIQARSRSMNARSQRMAMAPGGGGGGMAPRAPRGGGGGGRSYPAGGMGAHMAEFGFAYTLGTGIAQPIQSAIVQGFQIGIGLMTKPFQYFVGAFGERVQDEISDLKAAGGFLSISKRSKNPFIKDIDEAIEYQQKTNEVFAKMAGALPGVTNDYVQVGKRLGDTAARIVETDFKAAIDRANRIRATDEGRKFYGEQITGTGAAAKQEAITTILGELTKKTTIAGLGGRAGAGGIAGAYGLPGLTERMLSQEKVSMGQFQRYAAVFSDPTIADALNRNIEKINASAMNSSQRLDAVMKFLDEVVTPELIDKLRTSVDGVYQGLKSILFDPDSGLFGLGRNFKEFGRKINAYGQYVDAAGNVVDDINKAAKVDLSIFEILRDIFANFGAALIPLVDSLKYVFDPLQKVASVLMDARHYAAEFNNVFNQYREGLKNMAKVGRSAQFKDTVDIRATLATINAFLREFNVISEADFKTTGMELMAENLDIGKMMSKLIDQVLNSDIAKKIGGIIGEVVGTVLTEVAKVTGFISGRVASTNKLFSGLRAGFDKAKGVEAFKAIFKDLFLTMFKVIGDVMKMIPLEGYMLMAAMVVAPAIVQGIGMKIAESILMGMTMLGNNLEKTIPGQIAKGGASVIGGGGGGRTAARAAGAGSMFLPGAGAMGAFNRSRLGRGAGGLGRRTRGFFGTTGYSAPIGPTPRGKAGEAVAGGYLSSAVKRGRGFGIAQRMGGMAGRAGRFMPGPGALAFGAIDAGMRAAGGEDVGRAIGGAAATTIGSTLGGILGQALIPVPGVGAAVGGIAGGLIGDKIFSMLAGPTAEQQKAAQLQMQAAIQQKMAAELNKGGVDVGKAGGAFLFGDAKEVSLRLKELGLSANQGVRSFEALYRIDQVKQKAAVVAADALNKEIARQQALGRTNTEIAKNVRQLQDTYNRAKTDAEKSLTGLNKVWASLGPKTTEAILNSFRNMPVGQIEAAIAARIRNAGSKVTVTPGVQTKSQLIGGATPPTPTRPRTKADLVGAAKGSLGDAIASEMRMKPPGSNLVIANSSETVIPAAGGYGMKAFMDILSAGFTAVNNQYKSLAGGLNTLDQKGDRRSQQTDAQLATLTQNLTTLTAKVSTMASMGGMGGFGGGMALGGGYGGAGVQIAGQLGNFIKATGGAPGSIHEHPMHGGVRGRHAPGSYHYSGRAIDIGAYAGEQAGVIARIQAFNAKYGVRPVEFLHAGNDPRGHGDHVHVAYAGGFGNPAIFNDAKSAKKWEEKHLGSGVKSITTNTAELSNLLAEVRYGGGASKRPGGGASNWLKLLEDDYQRNINKPISPGLPRNSGRGGLDMWEGPSAYVNPKSMNRVASAGGSGPVTISAPITIHQQPGQDSEELAAIVAMKIGDAVAQARTASVYV